MTLDELAEELEKVLSLNPETIQTNPRQDAVIMKREWMEKLLGW